MLSFNESFFMFVYEFFRVLLKYNLERRFMRQSVLRILVVIIAVILLFQVYKNLSIPDTVGMQSGNFKALKESPNGVSSQASDQSKKVAPLGNEHHCTWS